jgi:hypothetical protein
MCSAIYLASMIFCIQISFLGLPICDRRALLELDGDSTREDAETMIEWELTRTLATLQFFGLARVTRSIFLLGSKSPEPSQ